MCSCKRHRYTHCEKKVAKHGLDHLSNLQTAKQLLDFSPLHLRLSTAAQARCLGSTHSSLLHALALVLLQVLGWSRNGHCLDVPHSVTEASACLVLGDTKPWDTMLRCDSQILRLTIAMIIVLKPPVPYMYTVALLHFPAIGIKGHSCNGTCHAQ